MSTDVMLSSRVHSLKLSLGNMTKTVPSVLWVVNFMKSTSCIKAVLIVFVASILAETKKGNRKPKEEGNTEDKKEEKGQSHQRQE